MQRIINILMNNKIETCQRNAFLIVWTFIYFLNQYALNASQDHMFFFSFFLKRSFNLESIGTTYLKFILSMQVMYLKIDFYWWTELLLISKFKNTTAGTPVLIWELSWLQRSVVSSSVFHTLQSTKFGPAGSGYRNCCIYWIHLRSERFLKFLFF